MTNIELYINGTLCDVAADIGVRLNRQLINPSELNTKDAQYSYSISLPNTRTNNRAFDYANVEETKQKFNRTYLAVLIINSVRVFSGNFRLSNIDNEGFKGNLYIPELKDIKDIFGAITLNQNPEYRIPFSDFVTSINSYNMSASGAPQMAIFPYTLYGILPKVPLNRDENNYSARTLWDETVRIGMSDLAPSINPLLMLKHIFNSQGYVLTGDVFDDPKITSLYMSYKNQADYVQPWNYGQQAKIKLNGSWSSRYNYREGFTEQLERGVYQGSDPTGVIYSCDFLDATNTRLSITEDTGGNVLYKEIDDNDGVAWVSGQIRIPTSGFYKVEFGASLQVYDTDAWRVTDDATGVQHIGGTTQNANNNFLNNMYEIRLCRDRKTVEFGLSTPKLDGTFYLNNQPQNDTFDADNVPKYFPQVFADGQINLIDIAQDRGMVLGFNFGDNTDYAGEISKQYKNPQDTASRLAQVQASKPALSFAASENTEDPVRLAIKSNGYWKYGRIGNYDSEGDNPNVNLDYSGGPFVIGMVLNSQGNPVAPTPTSLTLRTAGYYINNITGFLVASAAWEVSGFIDVRDWSALTFSNTVSDQPTAAIVAFYDISLQLVGVQINGPAVGTTTTYTAEPITPTPTTRYVRISGMIANPTTINGTVRAATNRILNRYPVERYYTYRIKAPTGSNYTGSAYIHNGTDIAPLSVTPFINGEALVYTSFAPIIDPLDLKLTIYLKTPDFDVNGTLVISREILESSEDVVGWEVTNKYKIDLINAPANYAKRGQFLNASGYDAEWFAQGNASAVVWFDAGELVTIASVASEGRYRQNGMHSTYGWVSHEVHFDLSIQPFRIDPEWLKVSLSGTGTAVMNWNDPVNFDVDSINLVGFLSADIKTDDFIDNFCKAFNLRLTQIDAKTFSLNIKQSKSAVSNLFIDLDGMASVRDRNNTPLGLPSLYKIGFTVDTDEQGYKETGDDGGGQYSTGVSEEKIVEQKSFFSNNWLKDITKTETGGNVTLPLAIISKSDVWQPSLGYPDAMRKRYTDLAYRFWYFSGLLNDLGATFTFNGQALKIARVRNGINNLSLLNYKNQPFTILDNYFTVLINGASHFTEIEGYLTAGQYQALDGSLLARFNGDMYYVAELSAYDPLGRNKTKIKLIRKI